MNVGIVGSGQLGWMMIIEGRKLQHRYFVLDGARGPAARIADGYMPPSDFKAFVDGCDVVTVEFEHVEERVLRYAEKAGKLRPSINAVALKRERTAEKEFLSRNHFPVGRFSIADNAAEALEAAGEFDRAVIKSSRGGYDGKGQFYVEGGHLEGQTLPVGERFVVEEFVEYDYEASIIASRGIDGGKHFHTPSLNSNESGILFYNEAPCDDSGMKEIASRLLDALDYVGVMGIEFFIVSGRAVINEFAPRVHNSGHHTLHGSSISQFEQHLRAITGLPISPPVLFRPGGIVNAVGIELGKETEETLLRIPETHVYQYGKSDLRKRKKMGHVNMNASDLSELRERRRRVIETIYGGSPHDYFGEGRGCGDPRSGSSRSVPTAAEGPRP